MDPMDNATANARYDARHEGGTYQRVEVITGRQRRRAWRDEEKRRDSLGELGTGCEHLGGCSAQRREPRASEYLAAGGARTVARFEVECVCARPG